MIVQTILVHDALLKRKAFLDSFAEGLEIYRISSLMRHFPELFKPVFVSYDISSEDVINKIILPPDACNDHRKMAILSFLFDYLRASSTEG